MLCKKPFQKNYLRFGCGQCLPCRINRQRLWSHRLLLEQKMHEASSFVTLTYDEDHLPEGGTLVPKHAQDWLKRLRKALEPGSLRFYLVGEYGDQTQRPHYHAALFGLPGCQNNYLSAYHRAHCNCGPCSVLRKSWGHGKTDCGTLNNDSASYLAGYVTKKMTAKNDPRLGGRHPEFARMSLRPGIGAPAIPSIADPLTTDAGVGFLAREGDVPKNVLHGRKPKPLGRYLVKKLREHVGNEKTIRSAATQKFLNESYALYKVCKETPQGFKKVLEKENQIGLNQSSRFKIFSKKGPM